MLWLKSFVSPDLIHHRLFPYSTVFSQIEKVALAGFFAGPRLCPQTAASSPRAAPPLPKSETIHRQALPIPKAIAPTDLAAPQPYGSRFWAMLPFLATDRLPNGRSGRGEPEQRDSPRLRGEPFRSLCIPVVALHAKRVALRECFSIRPARSQTGHASLSCGYPH